MSEEIYGTVQILELTGRVAGGIFRGIRMSARDAKQGVDLIRLKQMQLKMKLHYASIGEHNTMKLKDLEKLTGGEYAVLNIPFEDEKNLIGFYDRLKKLEVPFAELPDLDIGDGYTQIAYNPQDAEKIKVVVSYFKEKMEAEACEISLEKYEEMGGEKGKKLLDELAQKGYKKESHMNLLQTIRDRNKDKEYIPVTINIESLLKEETKDAYICNVPGTYKKGQGYSKTIKVNKEDCVILDQGQTIYTHLKLSDPETEQIAKNWNKVSKEHRKASERIRLEDTDALPNFNKGREEQKDPAPEKTEINREQESQREPVLEEAGINKEHGQKKEELASLDHFFEQPTAKETIEKVLKRETVKGQMASPDYIPVSFNLKDNLIAESPGNYFIKLPLPSDGKKETVFTLILPKKDTVLSEDGKTLYTNLKRNDTLEVLEQNIKTGKTENHLKIGGEELAAKCSELIMDQPIQAKPTWKQDILHKQEKSADAAVKRTARKTPEPSVESGAQPDQETAHISQKQIQRDVGEEGNTENRRPIKTDSITEQELLHRSDVQREQKDISQENGRQNRNIAEYHDVGITEQEEMKNSERWVNSIYGNDKFDKEQINEIQRGRKEDLDVSFYADPKYNADQMTEIRWGLEKGIDVKRYADPKYSADQMSEIREGLEKGLDVSEYAKAGYSAEKMKELREKQEDRETKYREYDNGTREKEIQAGLEKGIDVTIYDRDCFDSLQMRIIREGLEKGIDVNTYADPRFNSGQMIEIQKGLENGVNVNIYAHPRFNDAQMSRIREGLEKGIDVNKFADPEFNYMQMLAISQGLEDELDVSTYSKKEYDYIKMDQIRMEMKMKKTGKAEKHPSIPGKIPALNDGAKKLTTSININRGNGKTRK